MAQKKRAKKKSSQKNARSRPDPLDQVKDLLFGAELSAQQQRSRNTELRLRKKVERQSNALAERVTRLSARLTKTRQGLDEAIDELRKESARAQREIRRDVAAAVEQLQAENVDLLARFEERMLAVLNEVRQASADRQTLASMFEDFAHRVSGAKTGKNKKKK